MSFKDLIPWRRGHEVPVQRQTTAATTDANRESFGLSPLFQDSWSMFDRLFEGFPSFGALERPTGPSLSVDLTENDDEYELSVELPGVDEQDVELSVADGALTIKGEKRSEHESRSGNVHRMERSYGRFERTLPLPDDVDAERVSARYRKGVLSVSLPRLEEARRRRRKIEVRSVAD